MGRVVVVAEGAGVPDLGVAGEEHAVEVLDASAVRRAASGLEPLDGEDVVAVISTGPRGAEAVAGLAARLGLPGHPEPGVRTALHRAQARRALFAAGIPHPEYRLLTSDVDPVREARLVGLPAVVRSVSVLGLTEHRTVDTADEVPPAVAALGSPEGGLLVERALAGRRLVALAWLRAGAVVTDVVLEGAADTAEQVATQVPEGVHEMTAQAAAALGLTDGALTVELCVDDRFIRVAEVIPAVPARLTGQPLVGGSSPEAVSLAVALGR